MSEKSGKRGAKSAAALTGRNLSWQVNCKPAKAQFIAGGPVDVEFRITNTSRQDIFYYLAGETWGRPAYLKFSARLQPHGLEMRDPYPAAGIEPQGPITTVKVEPGATSTRTIILNQFVALEDARTALPPGESARLEVRWEAYIHAVRKPHERLKEAERVAGDFQLNSTRDDEKLRAIIESLAAGLTNDWQVISPDPVGRRHAILALASLRIPEVVPHLVRLVDFPEFEVQRWAQYALSELQK